MTQLAAWPPAAPHAAHSAANDALRLALRPWARRLAFQSFAHWVLRGACAALLVIAAIQLVGWFTPIPESQLRPLALLAAVPVLLAALLVGAWPASIVRRAWQLDARLRLADRLTTAWLQRAVDAPMATRQRADALRHLAARTPEQVLPLRWHRLEVGALIASTLVAAFFAVAPSPMQSVLDQQAAEAAAVQAAAQQLDTLRQQVAADSTLAPDQAQKVDEVLRQAQANLSTATSQQQAESVLAGTAQQLSQLGDPQAAAREEALGAMSETLSQEPLTRALGDALARDDPNATAQATQQLAANADQLSDVERQALSRALQRAANVGRGDPGTSAAMRDAAQALSNGSSASTSLDSTSQALQQALQSVAAQAALRSATQRLQDVRAALESGSQPPADSPLPRNGPPPASTELAQEPGNPVPVDAQTGQTQQFSQTQQTGAGVDPANTGGQATNPRQPQAAENVFVPGTPNDGPGAQNLVQQPFTVRGAPRPYREVLSQYAQAGRDYVDRADVAPDVRELVKQYFSKLEEGE